MDRFSIIGPRDSLQKVHSIISDYYPEEDISQVDKGGYHVTQDR